MEEFFLFLKEMRVRHAGSPAADEYLHLVSKLYLELMNTESPLNDSSLVSVSQLTQTPPTDLNLLHHLWLLNALSRYQWFILRNETLARATIAKMADQSKLIFGLDFPKYSSESKQFPLFLALNTARISRATDASLSVKQFSEFKKYVENPQTSNLESFPAEVRNVLTQSAEILSGLIRDESRNYFLTKTARSEGKSTNDAS